MSIKFTDEINPPEMERVRSESQMFYSRPQSTHSKSPRKGWCIRQQEIAKSNK